ncbi:MAG: bifunctional fucokinase/L-fucose-1-P-guanylyltransferase [Verrucomicrobia bacterium]|nr:bifunctional fucokinase/L-fucose-1-P-guanylyltransferase [Verrucomicrobiota bacterium]
MHESPVSIQYLISLPPRMAEEFAALTGRNRPTWFAASDPPGQQLGSGGGTAHLIAAAWAATGLGQGFGDWLGASRKLLIHGGGESRRLPAYAAAGKPLMPIPALRWSRGQQVDQRLLDLQLAGYERVLAQAPPTVVAMVTSGDTLLQFGRELPALPAVDVLGLGMWVTPEKAKDFGVFFTPRRRPEELAFFLQKPTAARIRELATEYVYLVDTGVWLLSERALRVLLERCGWVAARETFPRGLPDRYELYAQFGLALGSQPAAHDEQVRQLSCAVVPLPQPEFYHFGTSRQMIESLSALQNLELDETKLGLMGAKRHPDQYLQNAVFQFPLRLEENHTLWVENAHIPSTWRLCHSHVLTGVPTNAWALELEPGVCLDFVPVGETEYCIRYYGFGDSFRGRVSDPHTHWLDRPAPNWFIARGLSREAAGISEEVDIFAAPLFPVVEGRRLDPGFLRWLFASRPEANPAYADQWRTGRRLAAAEIPQRVHLGRLERQRSENRERCLGPMFENCRWSVFLKLDLESTARLYARSGIELPPPERTREGLEPLQEVHERMFRGAVLRHRQDPAWRGEEAGAFARLREMIVQDAEVAPVLPQCQVQEDQIVWARSPVRLDLAGGWTDTPPYCLEYGGKVVNLAVDLNGQPPIQVFAKRSTQPHLVVRSIDLGAEQVVRSYEELDTFARPGDEFAVAKAALALAGFLPRFHARGGCRSLEEQLRDFGGGIEVSLLAAVPKGSGLGTSSILAATLLAALGDLCGLNWDTTVLFTRTLALEQMLTTGGGWQDQAGGILRGAKLVETGSGLKQKPAVRWLPDHLFDTRQAERTVLLYYTGLTRLAKGILHEIVRGMFLNSATHLAIVHEIGANADTAAQAIQRSDYAALAAAIRQSWHLNQRLDAGTNPPEVQAILDPIEDYLAATKLLGAGGGGYLLMLAKDSEAAGRVRRELTERPPNPRARFVNFNLSTTGLQLTRS